MKRILSFKAGAVEPTGNIEFADEAGLAALRIYPQILTDLAQGYRNNDFMAPVLFPDIPVTKRSGAFPVFGKEAFLLYNTVRARYGHPQMMQTSASNATFTLGDHALGFELDERDLEETPYPPDRLETLRQNQVLDAIELERENAVATQITASGTVTQNTNGATKSYADGKDDFIPDYDNAVLTIENVGKSPNCGILSPAAFKALRSYPSIIDRVKYGAATAIGFKGTVSLEHLKSLFDLDELYVGKAVVEAQVAQTTAKVWDTANQSGNFVLFYKGTGFGVPGFGYSYRHQDYPKVKGYVDIGRGDTKVFYTERCYTDTVTLAAAGYLFYNLS